MHRLLPWLVAALAALPGTASAYDFYVFGDSLSDTGNNATLLPGRTETVESPTFIPTNPYESNRYSNDRVWTEAFAGALGLRAEPSLRGGNIYAFGGATTGSGDVPPNLRQQVGLFRAQSGPASPDDLFVLAGGGNDAREALGRIRRGDVPSTVINDTATAFASNIGAMLADLRAEGGERFIVWNAPNVGVTPAVVQIPDADERAAALAAANAIALGMNQALFGLLAADPLASQVRVFDLYGTVGAVVADPARYGLANVTTACGAVAGCDPSTYLFWDGIHPTSAGHAILANGMLATVAVPEPETVALLAAGLALVAWRVRARRR